jgi:hypothetical protein
MACSAETWSTGAACGLTDTRSGAQMLEGQRHHHRRDRGGRGLMAADLHAIGRG